MGIKKIRKKSKKHQTNISVEKADPQTFLLIEDFFSIHIPQIQQIRIDSLSEIEKKIST